MSWLSTSNVTSTSITVYADGLQYPLSEYDDFAWYIGTEPEDPYAWRGQTGVGGNVFTYAGLSPDTWYSFCCKAYYEGTWYVIGGSGYYISEITDTPAPETPLGTPWVTNQGENTFRINWNPSDYADFYTLAYIGNSGWQYATPVYNTYYTLNNTLYGYRYYFDVRAENSQGASSYGDEGNYVTTPKSPGNITCPAYTFDTIDIRLADGMTGNWTQIEIYLYLNGILSQTQRIYYDNYNSGERIVTFTNLSPDTEYKFNAISSYHVFPEDSWLNSYNWSNDLYVTTEARPSNFSWDIPKVQGDPATNLLYSEWNNFGSKINLFRQYRSLSTINFTIAYSGNTFYASMFNEVRNAILPMNGVNLPTTKLGISDVVDLNDADDLLASDLNALKDVLNSIT